MNNRPIVLSLYDFTGEALRPWAEAGYECHAFDIQHIKQGVTQAFDGGGSITYSHADLHNQGTLLHIAATYKNRNVTLGMAFPVCTDIAVSGAAWFAKKREADPLFQDKAASHAINAAEVFTLIGCPWFIENPVSVLSTLWRKPDERFQPYEYGGYLDANEADHPRWPEYIAPFDAYPKKTCLWTGGGFVMPIKLPVAVPAGYSTQHKKLGGKSQRTKDIRSATPRGFAIAVMFANMRPLAPSVAA